jgi:short-subunit dehydrogenase
MPEKTSTHTLVTGATSGIGLELARQAAADGRDLILLSRSASRLEAVADELRKKVRVHTIAEDLSQPGVPQRVFDRVRSLGAEVDCLINDAGIGDHGLFADADLGKLERMIGVNITALTALTRLFLPSMLARRGGHILNLASVTGFLPGPRMSVYYATKHYVLAFSEGLAEELRGSGVHVTALCPPPVRTAFSDAAGVAPANFMATTRTKPADVAEFGYRMMKRGRAVAVFSPLYKFLTGFLLRITPRFALRRLIGRLNAQGVS